MAYTNVSKNTSTYSNQTKSISTGTFLLNEDETIFLLEDGGFLELEESVSYTDTTKNTSSYTNQTKH